MWLNSRSRLNEAVRTRLGRSLTASGGMRSMLLILTLPHLAGLQVCLDTTSSSVDRVRSVCYSSLAGKRTVAFPLPSSRAEAALAGSGRHMLPALRAPRVLIIYSHESAEHAGRVLALSDRLKDDGVNVAIDLDENVLEVKRLPRGSGTSSPLSIMSANA